MINFFQRLNLVKIVTNHFSTFYSDSTKTINWLELLIVIVLPFAIAAYLIFPNETELSEDTVQSLFQAFAIMGGFLINTLVVLTDKKQKYKEGRLCLDQYILLKETLYNTSYGVLLCIICVILCAMHSFLIATSYLNLLNFLILATCFAFIHTLLMVIKRLNKIFEI